MLTCPRLRCLTYHCEYQFTVHPNSKLVIATRKSPLAMWQANFVAQQIQTFLPDIQVELVGFSTKGDEILNTSLNKIGGKGLFTKELEQALLLGHADMAVHSMKDLPVDAVDNLTITAVCRREDPRDVWISAKYPTWQSIPKGARIGTSSLRRQMQLLALRPDIEVVSLRGNIGTRLDKLHAGEYDAIILAAAGLIRMGLKKQIQYYFSLDEMLPAIGQGILGLQILKNNVTLANRLKPLNCEHTWQCLLAERALSQRLSANCQTPLAGFASLTEQGLYLQAKLGSPDGKIMISACATAAVQDAPMLGRQLAEQLLSQGGTELLTYL